MKKVRLLVLVLLGLVVAVALGADLFAPHGYAEQLRDLPGAPPSFRFPLGTDELGRDRFARLLYGSRVSILLAPAAALLSTVIAVCIGGFAGYCGGLRERALLAVTDVFASVPWLFLLLAVRAMLPLNVAPAASVSITFFLLGLLGWTSSARVMRASAEQVREAPFLLQAKAWGIPEHRLILFQVLPNLYPVAAAQFGLSLPVFLLAEANLGILGLGITEPLPSWGNLLGELQNYGAILDSPWILAPGVLLIAVLGSLQYLLQER